MREALTIPAPPSPFDDPAAVFEDPIPIQVDQAARSRAAQWSTTLRRVALAANEPVTNLAAGLPLMQALTGPGPDALTPMTWHRPAHASRRYLLTPEVEAVLDGCGLRGVTYEPDLWTWLYDTRTPNGYCDWCDKPIDARHENTPDAERAAWHHGVAGAVAGGRTRLTCDLSRSAGQLAKRAPTRRCLNPPGQRLAKFSDIENPARVS
ncbi:hypothetical protein [Micromonospora aurantiaca (nom. illeg.)]|uniref:hypothetical protein n=1 Tax=Micromonospora aurantiaca (nom. illeg.) TaxID=47850 RepID=UPI0033DB81CB